MIKCEEIISEYQDWLGIECSYDFPEGGYSFDKVPKDKMPPAQRYEGHDIEKLKQSVYFS